MQRAFYLLRPGSWRDYVNLLHGPYTIWHLSYVVLGAALVPNPDYRLLGWTMLAFFLAMGVGAHSLDELRGRPLGTNIPTAVLWSIGVLAAVFAVLIGLTIGLEATPLLLPFIATGAFLVFAYNLEWGPFHHDLVFAFAWGAFPVLTSYVAQSGSIGIGSIIIAIAAAGISHVQRILSKRVRTLRRRVTSLHGRMLDIDGVEIDLSREWLVRDHERVLFLMSAIVPATAIGLLMR